MAIHELAGKPAPIALLVNVPRLIAAYYSVQPDLADSDQLVAFGTSGHRGSSLDGSFNEQHVLAICQAISEFRAEKGTTGPLFLGMDTHALSEPALNSAVEVFAANGVEIMLQTGRGYTPTPSISHAIVSYNRGRDSGRADGVVITPSHNPPDNGGIKYNPPDGGPADKLATDPIQKRANELLAGGLAQVKRLPLQRALSAATTHDYDYITPYVADLDKVVDMQAIARSGLKIGADPMGGAGIAYWEPIASRYGLHIEIVNTEVDPTFRFMTVDWDGKIRMDCSSQYAMTSLIGLKDSYDIAFGNDPDFDRHGIVTHTGLMNPNHYLSVAVWYLFQNRPNWPAHAAVGKTVVTSSMIDRVASNLGRKLMEVPVGFKWFVDGLIGGTCGFGGEESAGASFLKMDGTAWATDKDGIILDLLAAEITAKTGRDPSVHYRELEEKFGKPAYDRIESPANAREKKVLAQLSPDLVNADTLGGEKILGKLTEAPGNGAAIGGLKVVTESGWFAARPSGTEDIYKIYAESFQGTDHLRLIQNEAKEIVSAALRAAGM